MELPLGITGFRDFTAPRLPVVDLQRFIRDCHMAVRQLGGRVVPSADGPIGDTNYARVDVELPAGRLAVLINSSHPFVAFILPSAAVGDCFDFVDNQEIATTLQATGKYRIVSATEAQSTVAQSDCLQLAEAELKQIRYWKPTRIGDIVYNHWD